jgi:hypothetical protein
VNRNFDFLQEDNTRLRNSNDQLRDEVETLRTQNRAQQVQMNELRDRLRPLDRSLQDLLYLPGVQNGEEGISNRLFVAGYRWRRRALERLILQVPKGRPGLPIYIHFSYRSFS